MDGDSTGLLIQQGKDECLQFMIDNRYLVQNSKSRATMDTIEIDMPDKNDGTLTKVPVLLQMPEELRTLGDSRDLETLDDTIDLTKFDQLNADGLTVLPASMLGKINLEDFVDVVTTFQCKFCRFSCAWKSGLMSHIHNVHMSQKLAVASSSGASDATHLLPVSNGPEASSILRKPECSITTPYAEASPVSHQLIDAPGFAQFEETISMDASQAPDFPNEIEIAQVASLPEKQIFLCGSCHKIFDTLDYCKNHMAMEHQVPLEREESVNKASKRKSVKLKNKHQRMVKEMESINAREIVERETLSKRKVRMPKALAEDYYLSMKKRKYSRLQSSQDKSFRCDQKGCNAHFRSQENLHIHMHCHVPNELLFQCVKCPEKAEHWRVMAMHLWKEHEVDVELYSCTICSYHSYSSLKLENHSLIHDEKRTFVCDVCRKAFKQMSQLRNHQIVHVDRKSMTEKRWFCEKTCDVCDRNFSDSKCLRIHMKAVHNKVKPYTCSFCGHTSARKAMLNLHMRSHTGEKPFKCNICEYRTGDHNSLRRHKMRHSGEKAYKCQHCSYACIQAISYKTHMKKKHPNSTEGLFCCSLCNFRSVSQVNYRYHMSDHKRGEIPAKTTESDPGAEPEPEPEVPPSQQEVMTLNGVASMAQLGGMLPANLSTTQLVYSCLNALTQQNQQNCADLPPGESPDTENGMQITIQIPYEQGEPSDQNTIYLTMQQEPMSGTEVVDEGGVTLNSTNESSQLTLEPEQTQALLDSLSKTEFAT